MRGVCFIDDTGGLLWADDGLCYVSNNEGAKVVVVEMPKSTHIAKRRPAEWRKARVMAVYGITRGLGLG